MSFDESLKAVFDEHLPSQQAKWLKEKLQQADIDAERLEHVNQELKLVRDQRDRLQTQLKEFEDRVKALDQKDEDLTERESVVAESEYSLTLAMERKDLQCEKRITRALTDMLDQLTKRTEIKFEHGQ